MPRSLPLSVVAVTPSGGNDNAKRPQMPAGRGWKRSIPPRKQGESEGGEAARVQDRTAPGREATAPLGGSPARQARRFQLRILRRVVVYTLTGYR